jgi:hypothetical protein
MTLTAEQLSTFISVLDEPEEQAFFGALYKLIFKFTWTEIDKQPLRVRKQTLNRW